MSDLLTYNQVIKQSDEESRVFLFIGSGIGIGAGMIMTALIFGLIL